MRVCGEFRSPPGSPYDRTPRRNNPSQTQYRIALPGKISKTGKISRGFPTAPSSQTRQHVQITSNLVRYHRPWLAVGSPPRNALLRCQPLGIDHKSFPRNPLSRYLMARMATFGIASGERRKPGTGGFAGRGTRNLRSDSPVSSTARPAAWCAAIALRPMAFPAESRSR